ACSALRAPLGFAAACRTVQVPCKHEQGIGETIEVTQRLRIKRTRLRYRDQSAFRTSRHSAAEVAPACCISAAGQDKLFQRRQGSIEFGNRVLKVQYLFFIQAHTTGNGQLGADLEQRLLDGLKQ